MTRARGSADRRVVTLRATDGVDGMLDSFFDPLVSRAGEMMKTYTPETLAEIERFLTEFVATMTSYAEEVARSGRQ